MRSAITGAILLMLVLIPGAVIALDAAGGVPSSIPPGQAPRTYDQVIPLLPNVTLARPTLSAEDWYEQGFTLTNEGQFSDALDAYGKALALNRSLLNAWYYTGDALFRLGRSGEAILAFENATAVDPDFVEAYFYESQVYRSLGRPRDAEDALGKGLDAAYRREAEVKALHTAGAGAGAGSTAEAVPGVTAVLAIFLSLVAFNIRGRR